MTVLKDLIIIGRNHKIWLKRFVKSFPLHLTIDNNDGCQETMTGSRISYHTNSTFFQPLLPNESRMRDYTKKHGNKQ